MGDEKTIGKPVGTDISSNKKTVFSYYLFSKASVEDKHLLASVFGKEHVSSSDIDFVRSCLKKYDILSDVHDLAHEYADKARKHILELDQPQLKELLSWFVDYNLSRNY